MADSKEAHIRSTDWKAFSGRMAWNVSMMKNSQKVALSIKQPWATMLVHGLKTIEIRRWGTERRGLVLIHAAKRPDDRPQGWSQLPKYLFQEALLGGGILGVAEIVDCRSYNSLEKFIEDQPRHLNDVSWYENGLFGFTFANAKVLPFRKYSGWVRFFKVEP
jgi:hypothetical protein